MEKRVRVLEFLVAGLVGLCVGLIVGAVRQPIVASAQGSGNQVTSAPMGNDRAIIATPSKYKVITGAGSGSW